MAYMHVLLVVIMLSLARDNDLRQSVLFEAAAIIPSRYLHFVPDHDEYNCGRGRNARSCIVKKEYKFGGFVGMCVLIQGSSWRARPGAVSRGGCAVC